MNLDREKLGFEVVAMMHVLFANHADEEAQIQFEKAVKETPEILSCYHVTGESDYFLQVMAKSLSSYEHFLRTFLHKMPGITSVKSSLCLREVKSSSRLPL